ncbi:MAG TPA: MarR family transcriptional regulator [Acidimicrobiales bacterium]
MSKTTSHLALDQQLCFALYAASRAVVRGYGPALDELGLTYPQYVTMLALWEEEGLSAGLSVGDLGERLHLDSGTLTPLLKRLEAVGYVERARDTNDERRVVVTLTRRGKALKEKASAIPASLVARSGLGLRELAALRDQLQRLTETLETEG